MWTMPIGLIFRISPKLIPRYTSDCKPAMESTSHPFQPTSNTLTINLGNYSATLFKQMCQNWNHRNQLLRSLFGFQGCTRGTVHWFCSPLEYVPSKNTRDRVILPNSATQFWRIPSQQVISPTQTCHRWQTARVNKKRVQKSGDLPGDSVSEGTGSQLPFS